MACILSGTIKDYSDNPVAGARIKMQPPATITLNGDVIIHSAVYASTDANGQFSISLTASDYAISINAGASDYTVSVTVPDGIDSVDLTTLIDIAGGANSAAIKWGVSDSETLDADGIEGLSNTALQLYDLNIDTTIDADGQYIYVAYPSYMSDVQSYILNGWSETPVETTVDVDGQEYTVLRSPYVLSGSIQVQVASAVVVSDAVFTLPTVNLAMNGHSITGGIIAGERAFRDAEGYTGTQYHYLIQGGSSAITRNDGIDSIVTAGTEGTALDGVTSYDAWNSVDFGALITISEGAYDPLGIVTTDAEIEGLTGIVQAFYAANPDAQAYILTFWNAGHDASQGAWREMMGQDQDDWEYIIGEVNSATLGGADAIKIPFLDLMGLVFDSIDDAPSGFDLDSLLYDTVHASAEMNWAGSVLTAAVVFGLDPDDAPLDLTASVHNGGNNQTYDGENSRAMAVTQTQKDFLVPLIRRVLVNGYDLSGYVAVPEPEGASDWVVVDGSNVPSYWGLVGGGHDTMTAAIRIESTADALGYNPLLSILDTSPVAILSHAGSETTLATSISGTPEFVPGTADDPVSILLFTDINGGLTGGATAIMHVKVGSGDVQTFTRTDALADEVSPLSFTSGYQSGYLFADEILALEFSDVFDGDGLMFADIDGATSAEIWLPSDMTAADYNGSGNNQGSAGDLFITGTITDR